MNINDFRPLPIFFEDIFEKQKELKFKFEPKAQQDFDHFDLDTFESQEVIKKYAWRITEELTEMLEAYYQKAKPGEAEHVYEEAIDAFNFFIELCLLVGYTPDNGEAHLVKPENIGYEFYDERPNDPEACALHIIYRLGLVCNHLKAREWRQSQYLVDLYKFWEDFYQLWFAFMELFVCFGWEAQEIADYYSLKYQVNSFRITTNY